MSKCPVGGLVLALITLSVLIIQSESISNVEALSTNGAMGMVVSRLQSVPIGMNQYALRIIDWKTFMKEYNKKYPSLTQMLVRQSLFMTRMYEAFITTLKHYMSSMSYHTTINKYSDATKEEVEMLTQGDSFDPNESTNDFMDDETIDRLLDSEREFQIELIRPKRGLTFEMHEDDDEDDDDIWSSKPAKKISQKKSPSSVAEETDNERQKLEVITNRMKPITRMQTIVGSAHKWLSNHNHEDESDSDEHLRSDEVVVHKDWRESGCIGLPRDQGYCESCYAFSSTSFAEWAYCRHNEGKFTRLSPQYVINCASHFDKQFAGCDRGPLRLVPDFFKEYGLELEKNVPYVEETKECHINTKVTPKEKWGSIRPIVEQTIRMKNNTDKLDKAIGVRPIILSMFVPNNFLGYGGGFIDDCDPGMGGHAVLIVGTMTENGVDYLLAQNSLGAFWGLQGYFKIKRTPEFLYKCAKHFMVPNLKFSPGS